MPHDRQARGADGPDAASKDAHGARHGAAAAPQQVGAPPGVQAVRTLQRQAGNRATARLLGGGGGGDGGAMPPGGRGRASSALLQRTLAVKDPEGAEYKSVDEPGFVSEAHLAIKDNASAIEAKDFMDFPGVYGNYLENYGIFESYLKRLADSPKDHGTFDLAKAGDVIDLYFRLRTLVLEDVGGEDASDEAPLDADFTPANILFASIDSGKVGSIYFPVGRIRLVHPSRPEISKHTGIQRFSISEDDYQKYDRDYKAAKARNQGSTVGLDYVRALPSCKDAVPGAGGRLIEFWNGGRHPSRGGPQPFSWALTQKQLNIIVRAAGKHSNTKLKEAMAADRLLAQIPLA